MMNRPPMMGVPVPQVQPGVGFGPPMVRPGPPMFTGAAPPGALADAATSTMTSGSVLHLSHTDPSFAANFLNDDNVMDYFCRPGNPFYDQNSVNMVVRMGWRQPQPLDRRTEEQELRLIIILDFMVGIQRQVLRKGEGIKYLLETARPPLFVIRKELGTQVLAYYYIINGTICQAPDFYSIIQSRLLSTLKPLKDAFKEVQECSRFSLAKGYYWEFKRDQKRRVGKQKGASDKTEEKPEEVRSTLFQRTRVDRLLGILADKFPPPGTDEQAKMEKLPGGDDAASVHGSSITATGSKLAAPTAKPAGNVLKSKEPGGEISTAGGGAPPTKRIKTE